VTAQLLVELIGWTSFQVPGSLRDRYAARPEAPVADGSGDLRSRGDGTDLAEFAGRSCYQSWDRPNPRTATNAGYLAHILEVRHGSVLEHASYTFYVQGVSRSLTHELVRHRHLSFSQLSQRYVDGSSTEYVMPPLFEGDEIAEGVMREARADDERSYERLETRAREILAEREHETIKAGGRVKVDLTGQRKQARQAARAVLANAAETKIVVTGNLRAWRHFIAVRATEHADVEIRAMAVEVFRHLQQVAGAAVQDGHIEQLDDGTEVVVEIPTEEEK
jgi:thymidylate synthase (FAD)